MEYIVFLTGQPGAPWRATVPWLPECMVEAPTRDEALKRIRQRISDVVNHIEVLRVQLPDPSTMIGEELAGISQTPWQWFGAFQDDSTFTTI